MTLWTPHLDEAVRAAYARSERGAVTRLASTLGVARSVLYKRALKLGVRPPRRGPWRDEEAAILALAGADRKGARAAARRLAGRSLRAVEQQMVLRHGTACADDPDLYTPDDIAALMGVAAFTVRRWCEAGKLKARVSHGASIPRYTITRRQVREYLIEYAGHWDHRRVDPQWLVDVLAKTRVRRAEP